MSKPVVEFVYFTASDAYKADDSLIDSAVSAVVRAPGSQNLFRGIQTEDGATLYIAVAWDSITSHENLIKNEAEYTPLVSVLQRAIAPSAAMAMLHAEFNDHAAAVRALADPATELAFFTLKSPDEAAVLPAKMAALEKELEHAPGRRSYTWGKVVEKEDQILLIIGWDSVEAHWDALKVDKPFADAVASAKESVNIDLVHVHFQEFKP
ncbi:hypothetical protein GLOTRDRAFT_121619 [Gloeophyllum trabeum ATCC 11539]|uniref:ABM domain-containing protein n=1 Tax=Gloeophyllum trabeum (strain ATCC 11539 / FP-39264 / Madison 617) TaxID=670483 RepID=S7Q4P1_GLOTA|nr:uncharacterized protein GLOTRDRAFT_121619 [Gloeophyllum trabeum ATCC 11539]EPQ54472.1 hypothetical protein GLOTRDRAFT_121619 [Gloeophyllum trabeum ATCC 11539]